MKLEISGFSHVAIRVTDLPRARHFYVDLLGLPVVLELEGVVLVKVGNGLLGIRGDAAGAKPGDRFDPHRVGLDHLSFAVDAVEVLERMKRDLDAAGIPNDGVHDEPALNAKGLVFYDPDGIAVELYAIQK
jgi:catechol 2,3-dioxygenase-like lactoylglutathione lyase family enzyme